MLWRKVLNAARTNKKAAEELWQLCFQSPHPASEIISAYTRSRRYIGSKDRQKLTNYVWKMLRFKAHVDFYIQQGVLFQNLLDQELIDSPDMPEWVRLECPSWLLDKIPDAEKELKAMQTPAPTIYGQTATVRRSSADWRRKALPVLRQSTLLLVFSLINAII